MSSPTRMLLISACACSFAIMLSQQNNAFADDTGMVQIPAGHFLMGSNKTDASNKFADYGATKPWYLDEHPEHDVDLPAFYIDKYEVTNRQYLEFVAKTNTTPPEHWVKAGYVLSLKKDKLQTIELEKLRALAARVFHLDMDTTTMDKDALLKEINNALQNMDKLPVIYVSWHDADAYCRWSGKRLPREAEWEKAARGAQDWEFPWGNEWREGLTNTGDESWEYGIAPVGSYASDKSTYGIYDMAGNVREWVADWYQPYPHSDYQSKDFGEKLKVVRGSGASGGHGHYYLSLFQRGAYRGDLDPASTYDDVGFRCAADAPPVTTSTK